MKGIPDINQIKEKTKQKNFYREHALLRMLKRNVSIEEVKEAIQTSEVIEDYPDDKYGPTCLLYGTSKNKRKFHVLVTRTAPVWVITIYEPNEKEWINFKKRRKQ